MDSGATSKKCGATVRDGGPATGEREAPFRKESLQAARCVLRGRDC